MVIGRPSEISNPLELNVRPLDILLFLQGVRNSILAIPQSALNRRRVAMANGEGAVMRTEKFSFLGKIGAGETMGKSREAIAKVVS
jgi:hypothetical protein